MNKAVIILLMYATLPCIIYSMEYCGDTEDVFLFGGQTIRIEDIVWAGKSWRNIIACKKTNKTNETLATIDYTHLLKKSESQLEELHLKDVTLQGTWGDCLHLKTLRLENCDLTRTPPDWLAHCTQLLRLELDGYNLKQIRAILDGVPQIEELEINVTKRLVEIMEYSLFTKSNCHFLKSLEILYPRDLKFDESNIENTSTSWAEVSSALTKQLSLLLRLEHLRISIEKFDMCVQGSFPSVSFPSLQYLELSYTNTTRACFRQYRSMPHLRNLKFNSLIYRTPGIKTIEFRELFPASKPHDLYVGHMSRSQFIFTREDFLMLPNVNKQNITFDEQKEMTVECNRCNRDTFWLARAVRMGLIKANLYCSNGLKLTDLTCERLDCERVACNSSCVCCRNGPDAVFADCRDVNLTELPADLLHLSNLNEILAPNNSISSLPESLPDTLLRIDLSNNRIRHINETIGLFTVKERRLRIAGNPLVCTCDNYPLLHALRHENMEIEDKIYVECEGDTEKLTALPGICESRELNISLEKEKKNMEYTAKLAADQEKALVIIIIVITVITVIALLLGIALYYRRTIQILLFARGWCMCWLKNNELDQDCRYDVFISFCHEDAELVLNQLLPKLDQDYSVCVHLRDWMPGEMILSQIRRSVEESRRTLIILSKNFDKSLWGILEFETAYARSLNEKRVRIVMVVLDDVLESPDLNKELRQYVQFHTYVRWDDPFFFSKLRYALPHHPAPFQSQQLHCPARYTTSDLHNAAPIEVLPLEDLPEHPAPSNQTQPELSP